MRIAHPLFLVLKEIIIITIIIPEILLLLFISHRSHSSHRFLFRFFSVSFPLFFRFFRYRIILYNLNQICSISTRSVLYYFDRLWREPTVGALGEAKFYTIIFKILQNFFPFFFAVYQIISIFALAFFTQQ